jgi:uncharacterized RDD family membrane protein YckC
MRSEYQVLTPESVEFSYELAGFGSRMLAVLIDLLVLVAATLVALVVGTMSALFARLAGNLLLFVLPFAVLFGYFIVFEWRMNGQTLGKRLLDLRVIDDRGFSIDLFQAVIRNLLRLIDMMPFICHGVGGLAALCNSRQKRLGDSAAGTLVVKVRGKVMPAAVMAPGDRYNSLQEDSALRARIRSRISLEERELLLQLCVRRHELVLDARQPLFEEAAGALERKLEVRREGFLSAEKFVQNVAAIALAEAPARGGGRRRAWNERAEVRASR